jgi:NTE family protein
MEEHWLAGYRDAANSLAHREIFEPPDRLEGVRTFDCSKTQPP